MSGAWIGDLVSPLTKNLRSLFGAENLQQEKSWEAEERLVRVDDMPYIARGESAQITDSPGSRAKDAFWTPTSWHTCIHFWVHGISSHKSEQKIFGAKIQIFQMFTEWKKSCFLPFLKLQYI